MNAKHTPREGHPGIERVMGRFGGHRAGPALVIVADIHGNEPAGLEAAARVLARLGQGDIVVDGDVVVLAGNVVGLRTGARFVSRDLNRGWTADNVARVRAADVVALESEDREQRQLLDAIDDVAAAARGPVVLADLHTSSAPGVPFVLFGATPAQAEFVEVFPVPAISGIVEQVEGVLSEFVAARGHVTFSVEGGQHDAPASRDALEAVIWLSLQQAKMLPTSTSTAPLPEVTRSLALLDQLRGDLPRRVDVVGRHAISADDDFVMELGFRNVDRIGKGQLLAKDKRGEVRASEDGVVVLPLYQKLGNDGFFWGKEVGGKR
jgi:succinylglutamate desuccinylase